MGMGTFFKKQFRRTKIFCFFAGGFFGARTAIFCMDPAWFKAWKGLVKSEKMRYT